MHCNLAQFFWYLRQGEKNYEIKKPLTSGLIWNEFFLTGCWVFNLETLCLCGKACVEIDEDSVGGGNVSRWN